MSLTGSLSDVLPGEPVKTLSVKWGGMSFGKFCTVPEFVPYKLNYPGDNNGFDYEMYQGTAPGLEGGYGFINLHYMADKQGEIDYLYNDSASGMNFMLKMKVPKEDKKIVSTPQFNLERRFAGIPFGFIFKSWDGLDLTNPTAGLSGYEVGGRGLFPTPAGNLAVQLNSEKGKEPILGAVLDASEFMKGLKVGVQTTAYTPKNIVDLQFRALLRQSNGLTMCTQYTAWGKAKKDKPAPKNILLTSFRFPAFSFAGVNSVTPGCQIKAAPSGVEEVKAVAELDFGDGLSMKVKATKTQDKSGWTGMPTVGASFICTGAGGHQICLGTKKEPGKGLQFGFQVWKGYYNFGQW